MKHLPVITTVFSNVELPDRDIEAVINNRLRKNKYRLCLNAWDQNIFMPDFEIIQTSSTEIPAKGKLLIFSLNKSLGKKEKLEIPVQSCFLVTCIKGKDCRFKIGASMSMS